MILSGMAMATFGLNCIVSEPIPRVRASSKKADGAVLFHEKGCEHCHGVDGVGTDLAPELSSIGRKWKKPQIEKQIVEGGNGMPPFGQVLQGDEITDLVEFLHAKRKKS